jgi:hemoglobin-like flavoprotein
MGESLSLTADEIEQVRDSFDQVWAISSRTAELFYIHLFANAVFVRPLFGTDVEEQKRKFISTLANVVASLDSRADLDAAAERLAQQHAEFGVSVKHHAVLGEALFWSLEQEFGPRWTPGVAACWRKAYRRLSERMLATTDD